MTGSVQASSIRTLNPEPRTLSTLNPEPSNPLSPSTTMVTMPIIGHGVDLVEVARIAALLDEHGPRFVERCFTEAEQAYAESGRRHRAERYAARFAGKEAVLKALGTGWRQGIAWRNVEVRRQPSGRPTLALSGGCAEWAARLGIVEWHLSLSHAGGFAVASVIAWGAAS